MAAEDVGADLEHCQSLIERITGRSVSDSNVTVDQSTLAKVNKLGEQIMRQQANGSEIKGKLSEVNNA